MMRITYRLVGIGVLFGETLRREPVPLRISVHYIDVVRLIPLQLNTRTVGSPPPLIKPQPRLAVPLVLPQEDRSDSCIYKKIRGKRKERSSSAGEVRFRSYEIIISD
ncbi:hypothetical protein RB195_014181 [Necator americanus]|uniref:Uncharacterized protein n=1 Tax=Necator americanus TaxID=51031 RepID=A0ABR1DZ55_NECAM